MHAPPGTGRKLSAEALSQLDAKADGLARQHVGREPRWRPLHLAIIAYLAIGVVPWLVLSATGRPPGELDLPLVTAGIAAAVAVYFWQRRRLQRWHSAQRAAYEELVAAAERAGGHSQARRQG